MRIGRDGRARIDLQDIDLRAGFRSYRWFWVAYAVLVVVWLFS
jgi:hypothetical protein